MPYANNAGVRIHYEVDGTGPALVLHHAFTQCLEDWSECGYVAALLRAADLEAYLAAVQDGPAWEDMLETMAMPCCIYARACHQLAGFGACTPPWTV